MADKPVTRTAAPKPPKRVYVQIPPNWATMTDAEKKAAGLEMARALQKGLGIKPELNPGAAARAAGGSDPAFDPGVGCETPSRPAKPA
jgi:hypothetical protein